jgi:hypothetical protein
LALGKAATVAVVTTTCRRGGRHHLRAAATFLAALHHQWVHHATSSSVVVLLVLVSRPLRDSHARPAEGGVKALRDDDGGGYRRLHSRTKEDDPRTYAYPRSMQVQISLTCAIKIGILPARSVARLL